MRASPVAPRRWEKPQVLGSGPWAFLHNQPSLQFLLCDVLICYSENYEVMVHRSRLIQVNL